MLDTSSASISFQTPFEVILTVTTDGITPIADIAKVTADFEDPGVTVIAGANGLITIKGTYTSIIPVDWQWIDLDRQIQSGKTVPTVGTYEKIVKVESPSFLSKVCVYTIESEAGIDTFSHTVSLSSWSVIADTLATALAGAQ